MHNEGQSHNNSEFSLRYMANIVQGECILQSISTIRLSTWRFVLYIIASVILIGIPILLIRWFPKLKVIFYYEECALQQATHVSVINYDEQTSVNEILEGEVSYTELDSIRTKYFVNRYMKYVINTQKVVKAQLFNYKLRTYNAMAKQEHGLNGQQVQKLRSSYGLGTMVIEQPTKVQILVKEITRPLYMFVFFSVALWLYQKYYYYAGIILLTTIVAIIATIIQMVSLNRKIYDMAYYEITMNVLRGGQMKQTSSIDLVPGDIVFLKSPIKIPFQGIILEGSALINECALTGQSVPVVKKADLLQNYRNKESEIDKTSNVYEGTTIVQVNSKKKMVLFEAYREQFGIPVCVTRTNFVTMKGQLIRIILFPKEQENIFQRQSSKFLFFLFAIAIITYLGMIQRLSEVVDSVTLFLKVLDLIVITVPPALPVSMAFGVIYAVEKLQKKSIFCIDQSRIITGGVVQFSCFDKTGTLTEDYMDFQCLVPADNGRFYPTVVNHIDHRPNIAQLLQKQKYLSGIFSNMAANHSIIRIEQTGQLIGDPMEIKLLQFGQFTLNQSNENPEVIFSFESKRNHKGQVYRRFDFDSDVQRMSVVCKHKEGDQDLYYTYAKGSPEIMLNIMNAKTVPETYHSKLKEYASNGFRVLAIASKRIAKTSDIKTLSRQQVEADLTFNGFQVFENKLKPETKGAIKELKDAQIGVVMITGDNPLTGSNISFKCGISNKKLGMIICDYKNGKFFQEDFVYFDHEEAEPTKQKNKTQINQEDTIIDLNQSIEKNPFTTSDIQLNTVKQNNHQITNQFLGKEEENYERYMEDLLKKAKSTKCQICLTGSAFNKFFEGNIEEISALKRQFLDISTVYARTKPNDKAKIVMVYQHTGKTVSMCGDGANDCGALKQADIGLSLSQAEASISAPFTSQIANISSVVQLIKECRAGLATNFSLFNIMASYSLVQYTTSSIVQLFYSYPADFHYLYWDLADNFFFIVVIGYTATQTKLSIDKPNNSLFCLTNITQILIVFGIQILGQISMILAMYGRFNENIGYSANGGFDINKQKYIEQDEFIKVSPETNVLFLFTNFMYISTLIAFSIGGPWKKPFFTNLPFMIILAVSLTYAIIIVVVPEARIPVFFLEYMPEIQFNGFVLGVALSFGLSIIVLQKFLLEPLSLWLRKKYSKLKWL